MKIRSIGLDELHLVRDVALDVWPKTFADVLTPSQIDFMMDWMYSMEALQSQIQARNHKFLLAEENQKAIGYCSYEVNCKDNKTKIHKIYFLQETQGKGYGKKMIEEVKEMALKNQQSHIYLNVNRFNSKAIAFYLRLGFYQARAELIDIGNGFVMDDYVMEMPISNLQGGNSSEAVLPSGAQ
ncbi:GNAT family N-acetyltransferase [Arthrospiribacter ruber]|uniref:GNAT family N-acetyltransferase n=1 Tax=Arthrospiribacter ruber TaxID=2487934 RepID=A0A951M788_9BACT|nr:GNAT family N-acetyltransferase [Arthrospiribacter ruber]MBW3466781.1 GNAT family N-acetyltransferase [Arthrospiribacter ruber]